MDHNLPPSTGDPSTTQTTTTKSTYSASQPRRFDWVFRALHSVASRRSNSITLSLPSTVIFATGSPVKWLTTLQDGRVAREMLNAGDNYQSSMRHVRSKAKNNSEINVQEQIKQIHAHFHTFRSQYPDFTDDPVNAPLCIAWYTDGKKEFVNSQTLLMLMKHREWRVQLTALQAYIHPKRTARGHYDQVHQVRVGADDITDNNAALDIVTKSLAMYSEKAYAVKGDDDMDGDDDMQSISTPPSLPSSNIKVDVMDAEFIFDSNEKLWFSHLSNVTVQTVHAKKERNMELKRIEENKVIEAAFVVAAELRRLLKMAANRGVAVSASFAHFDTQGVGYADSNNLVEGLARLGIGISHPAADMLMGMIGTASSLHFRAKDLVLFAELEEEEEADMDEFDDKNTARTSRTPPRSVKKRKQAFQRNSDSPAAPVDSKPGTPLDLNYTVDAPNAPKEDLPRWARSKSKKAYGELKKAETRYNKNLANKPPPKDYDDDISSDEDKPPPTADQTEVVFPDELENNGEDDSNSVASGSIASLSVSLSLQSTVTSADGASVSNLPAGENPIDHDIDLSDADNLFHAHSSIVMSYRVFNAANKPVPSKKSAATVLQQSAAYHEANNLLERLAPPKETPFQLVIVPDIFMTLDTLSEAFAPLLDQHPNSSILLVGLPGLPNTLWPKGLTLNNDTHAECVSNLLHHVSSNGEFSPTPAVPLFFIGFGIGASALTGFGCGQLNDPSNANFKKATLCMILINSFAKVDQELKRTIQGMRRVLKKDEHQERVQMLMSILFSDQYLEENGRDESMELFWSTRRRISLDDAPKKSHGGMCSGNGLEGVTMLLHGMQSSTDFTVNFELLDTPLLFVQSSKDNFIAPTNIEVYEKTEEEFEVVASPRLLLPQQLNQTKTKVLNVQWIHCGHEMLQERTSAVTGIIQKMIAAAHDEKEEVELGNLDRLADNVKEEQVQNLNDFFDILEPEEPGMENMTFEQRSSMRSSRRGGSRADSSNMDSSQVADDTADGEEEEGGAVDDEKGKLEEKQAKKRARRARENQVRKQREEERKMRKIADDRAKELKAIRQGQEQLALENKILEERHAMHREDMRSSLSEEYYKECEEWEVQAEFARAKAKELQSAREEDELAELEVEQAKKRAQKHEQRRARIQELRVKYLDDEMTMDGDKAGVFSQGINSLDAHQAVPYCQRLLADLFQCRSRMIDAMKRAKLANDKVQVFQGEYDVTERDVRALRRTQRLAATNSTFQAIKPTKRELEELKKKLDDRQNELSEIKSLLTGRKELLEISNRSVQGLKVVLATKEEETKEMIKTLKAREDKMKSNLAVFRVTKDNYSNERGEIEKILSQSSVRMKVVSTELKKVKRHKGKFVDTDVWQKGVMQRMLSVDISEHLDREQTTLERVLKEFNKTLSEVKSGIFKCDKDIKALMKEIDELKAVEEEMTKGWAKAMSKSVAVEFEEQMKNENNAVSMDDGTEEKRKRAKESMKHGNLGDEVRLKNSEDRNKEEKMWVGMDVIVNPDKYSHVSEVEAEEMKFDPDYGIKLELKDIKRLLALPAQIQLALPFLYSPLEVKCHQLLTKFTMEQGESYFQEKDKATQDADVKHDEGGLTPEQQREAERQLNVLLKERRCADTRSLPKQERDDEQKDWVKLDKILSPQLHIEQPRIGEAGRTKVFGKANAKVEYKSGDIYEEARKDYVDGETEQWHCPFDDISLREIYQENIEDLEEDDERYVKFLMDKYYCNAKETRIGLAAHRALEGINKVMKNLQAGKHPREGDDVGGTREMFGKLKGRGGGGKEEEDSEEKPELLEAGKEDYEGDTSHKVFGSWYVVHPAAIGKRSQTENFNSATFDEHVQHPAAFQYFQAPPPEEESVKGPNKMDATIGHPKHAPWMKKETMLDCKVVSSMEELAKVDYSKVRKGMTVLFTSGKADSRVEESGQSLESRQSRSHKFKIGADEKDKILDLTISVVFQGVFGPRGYRLGRLAVQLYRIPSDEEKANDTDAQPQALGCAPYELQILNTPDALGRIVIHHKPRRIPVEPGTFQVVIGAAAASKYSIQVHGTLGEAAKTVLDAEFESSLTKQTRLSQCSKELAELWTSMRLAERKITVCQGLIDEAESESARCEADIEMCNNELAEDDEIMEMGEEERNDIFREIKVLEVEFAHWCKLFATRQQEKKDIKEGLEQMAELRRDRITEKDTLKRDMEHIRKIIPSATAAILGAGRATEVALALNAPLNLSNAGASGRWQAVSAVKDMITSSLTPAEEVRRLYQREGMKALTLEERQWSMLDQCASPDKWEWLRLKEEEEDKLRETRGARKKKRKYNAAIEQFRIEKNEIDRVKETAFSKLQRREVTIKKLINKYHDDAEIMKRKAEQLSSGFDAHLAAETRSKISKTMTPHEREWATVDRVLNPSAWLGREVEGQSGFDHHKDGSQLMELTEEEQAEMAKEEQAKFNLGKVMGGNKFSFAMVLSDAKKSKKDTQAQKPLGKWVNEYTRADLLRIWSAKSDSELASHDEERAWNLMKTYNGSYSEYMEGCKASEERQKRLEEMGGNDWVAVRSDAIGESLETDIDARCRTVLSELDKTISFRNPFMDSAVLHIAPQRFPTTVLRLELERELDRLLSEQIYERERASKFLVEDSSDSDYDVDGKKEDSGEDEEVKIINAEVRRKERRAEQRAERAKEDVKLAKKRILMDNKSATELAQAKELEALGFGGCLACRKNPCEWLSSLDVAVVMKRKEQISDELNYVRKHPEMLVMDSQVALSAQRGGSTRFKREDLIHELAWESRELERRMKLNGIDRELHDCYATRKEYMEVKVLHGYSTLLWTGNARRALEREHNKLVAMTTAVEVVDDILEWMLEGWYFGERESMSTVAGYVPSIKKDGFVKPGTDATNATAIKKAKLEEEKKEGGGSGGGGGGDGGDDHQGTPWEKLVPIEVASRMRIGKEKVVKKGDERDHVLNETEQTMKFGLFCLTFMYFRAMKMVRREKKSWEGGADKIGTEFGVDGKKGATAERKKMKEEARNEADRQLQLGKALAKAKEGFNRKKLREDKERAEAAKKLYDKMRQEKMEKAASVVLARVYRGHLGRKAARRWARKKAELEAMNALMNASAITVQRVHRGHHGRVAASEVRLEMALFIARIREDEALADEEEYWNTHMFQRYKRDIKEFVTTIAEGARSVHAGAKALSKKGDGAGGEDDDF